MRYQISITHKLNKLKNWQAALVFVLVGVAVYFTGLTSPFQGDDISQIVQNPPVHSISHIKLFFEGGTFYTGNGLQPLSGNNFRPLMSTVFSLLYTLFGAHPFYYHVLQLAICIGSAFLLYLIFRYSFKPFLALALALIFLVHPLDSQVVFAVPSMQDALFVFFGLFALRTLLRLSSIRSLIGVTLLLFLSLLSKETAVVFVALSLLYLFWFDRRRLLPFLGILLLPAVIYVALRVHAVGLDSKTNIAPIDHLSLIGRLFTMPSEVWFYITKFVFPWKLASGYYWTYPTLSFRHVLLPTIADLFIVGLFLGMGALVRERLTEAQYYSYLFFATWTVLGILPYLQIIPLDLTASETWFYLSMSGLLGMIGIFILAAKPRINLVLIVIAVLLVILGARTALRGTVWEHAQSLAYTDISVSPEDYNAYDVIAGTYIQKMQFSKAETYAQKSVDIFPTDNNYNDLGIALMGLGKYSAANNAFDQALEHGNTVSVDDNLGLLSLQVGAYPVQKQLLQTALQLYPHDSTLWMYLAIVEERNGDNGDAKTAISQAAADGSVPGNVYSGITNNQPFTFRLTGLGKSIQVQ